jgi:phospho-N-acetylmuramoyl-pentapeptide-transferase
MTETGTMALTLVLATIAFMTDALGEGIGLSVLPIIGFLLFVTVASNIIQVFSKKVLGRKVFRIAPLHHHFEAIGWPSYKVTMRYWVLSVMCAFVGVVFALLAA